MLLRNGLKAGLLILMVAGLASAHLTDDDKALKPTAGESVIIGSTYKITWTVAIHHTGGTNIDLSTDGGTTWTTIKENFADVGTVNNFNWTVAGTATDNALIRICQHGTIPVKACLATEKTSRVDQTPNGNYVKVTSPFKLISGSTALRQTETDKAPFVLDFNPDTRNVNVSFALAETGPVLLQAFDARGRLIATLAQDEFTAGEHKLSLFSNALAANGGSLVFKLKAGGQIHSRIWTSAH
jgi:hypothetical protein